MSRLLKPTVEQLTLDMERSRYDSDRVMTKEMKQKCMERTRDQIKYEFERLQANKVCKSNNGGFIGILDGLNKDELFQRLMTDFNDPAFMESVRCILDFIIDQSSEDEKSTRMKIHEYLDDLKRFGADSVNGYAIKAGISGNIGSSTKTKSSTNKHIKTKVDKIVVMKCPRSPFKSNEMTHEVIIGLEGLNAVREDCPHFSYLYDAFSQGPAMFDQSKESLGWANQRNFKVSYALYENIENAKEINTVQTPRELILYYLQCLIGLQFAHQRCDFTHYDAHDENVLLRHVSDSEFYVKYVLNGRETYLKSPGAIAMFIDYGMSHIKTKSGRDIGILDHDGYFRYTVGNYYDDSNIMGDAYKLICMLMMMFIDSAKEEHSVDKTDLVDLTLRILGYFYGKTHLSDEEMVMIYDRQWDDRYHIRKELTGSFITDESGKQKFVSYWSLQELIDYCIQIANEMDPTNVIYTEPEHVFGTEKHKATLENMKTELREMTSAVVEIPDSYELYASRDKPIFQSLVDKLNSNPVASVEREELNCAKFLSYVYESHLFSVEHQSANEIERHLAESKESIQHIYELIDMNIELKDKIEEVTFCSRLNDSYTPLKERLVAKYRIISEQLAKFKTYILRAEKHLRKIVFGNASIEITERLESENKSKPVFELWSLYRNTVASLNETKK